MWTIRTKVLKKTLWLIQRVDWITDDSDDGRTAQRRVGFQAEFDADLFSVVADQVEHLAADRLTHRDLLSQHPVAIVLVADATLHQGYEAEWWVDMEGDRLGFGLVRHLFRVGNAGQVQRRRDAQHIGKFTLTFAVLCSHLLDNKTITLISLVIDLNSCFWKIFFFFWSVLVTWNVYDWSCCSPRMRQGFWYWQSSSCMMLSAER